MSRKITSYFGTPVSKKTKISSLQESKEEATEYESSAADNSPKDKDEHSELPDCWNITQKNEFCSKHDWLIVKGKKLGCAVCKHAGTLGMDQGMGMKISKEWAKVEIVYNGDTRKQQLTSLRKKIFEHKESASHKALLKQASEAQKKTLENVCLQTHSRDLDITAKIFRTAYKVAKKNQSFNDFEAEINLQELNGVDMGRILHSTNACANIVNHIGKEMKKKIVQKIIESNCKMSLLIDESTTLSQLSCLVVYVRLLLSGTEMTAPVNLFIDLIELNDVTAKGIFTSLMNNLKNLGFTEEYLNENLVALATDGAAVMLGKQSGVQTLFKNLFPSILVWHCANHRLELSVADTVKTVSGIDRFKSFVDKLYVLYHASPKNAREIKTCAKLVEIQLLKIGRVLSTRWVASSFRSVSAVWEDYEALVRHFEEAKDDRKHRDGKERSMYEGLLKKITSVNFILDLALMCDSLQELSELSLDLQERDINLCSATKKIKNQIKVFEEMILKPGPYYSHAISAVNFLKFKDIPLQQRERKNEPAINPSKFYETLKQSMTNRLLSENDSDLSQWANVLDPSSWPKDVQQQLTYGENEVRHLCRRFRLEERQTIRGFREYVQERKISDALSSLMHLLATIPISTSECERGFSQMNLIITPTRSSLLTSTTSALMHIRMVGPPLVLFDPTPYVKSWLYQGRHLATDKNSKERNRYTASSNLTSESYDNMIHLWKLL